MLQVWRWSQQYQAQLTGEALPEMMELIGWLKANIPADDNDPSVGRISHGDYRCAALTKQTFRFLGTKLTVESILHTSGARCMRICIRNS